MRLTKMVGLAALAALAAMAFLGASSASASTTSVALCKKAELVCPAGEQYPAGTKIHAELLPGTTAKLTGALEITCKKSLVEGTTSAALSSGTLLGSITALTFTECGTTCNSIVSHVSAAAPWTSHLKNLGKLLGEMVVLNPLVLLNGCTFFKINCVASAAEVGLHVDPVGTGELEVLAVNEPLSLGICGNGTWNATYIVTTPKPAYIES
ncbi:MAG TPA: hypothetical protein VNO20_02100 [Solirubrobacterales bacterium]|nr:hypothetical protein [Solirubrobacterales bacterium]